MGRRILVGLAVVGLLCVVAVAIAARNPIMFVLKGGLQLPSPDGAHGVGRATWDVADPNRPEIFTEAADDHRTIRVDVYYPAEKTAAAPGKYLEPEIAEGVTGVPALATDIISPNWRPDATPDRSGAPYPLLVFSPGVDGPPTFYTSLLEHVASRGYIVLALWHPYTIARTRFADGRIVESTYEGNSAMWEGEEADRDMAKQKVSREWAEDMVTALDEAARRNGEEGVFQGLFDLEKIGSFGHSFGGQNAIAVMTLDTRVKAGLNMDGTAVYQPIIDEGVTGAVALVSDSTEPPPEEYLAERGMTLETYWNQWDERNCPQAMRSKAKQFYSYQIDGLDHSGFCTDLAILRPLYPFAIDEEMVGTVEGPLVLKLLTDLVTGFFDEQLRGGNAAILHDPQSHYAVLHKGINTHPPWPEMAE